MWLLNVIWVFRLYWFFRSRYYWEKILAVFIAIGLTMWVNWHHRARTGSCGKELSTGSSEGIGISGYLNHYPYPAKYSWTVMVIAAANFASAIVLEAGLSFLGIQPPNPVGD